MNMKKCKNYCGVKCVDGNCPIALREEYEERCYPVVEDCGECHYYKGCEDCAFSEECKDKPIEVFDKQGEFTPEFKDLFQYWKGPFCQDDSRKKNLNKGGDQR